jgi:hypothetical protein
VVVYPNEVGGSPDAVFQLPLMLTHCIAVLLSYRDEVSFPQTATPPTPGSGHQWTKSSDSL